MKALSRRISVPFYLHGSVRAQIPSLRSGLDDRDFAQDWIAAITQHSALSTVKTSWFFGNLAC